MNDPKKAKKAVELILLRALAAAEETIEYNLGHIFGSKIEEEMAGNEEKIMQKLEEEEFDLQETLKHEMVKLLERKVKQAIKKIKKDATPK